MISLGSIRGMGRAFRPQKELRIPTLSSIWARRICGRHNKDIKLFIVGPQGSGKSRSAIRLGIDLSKEIAKLIGGKPEDYFPLDLSHVFIGDPEAHADALKHIKKHCIYILDDAGVSINARNFMTSYNKSLNDIFQTVRTDNAIIIINAPDSFLIDNVPRTLVSHYAEISESMHSLGYNLLKIFKLERKFREGETHYHHYQFGNTQVVRWKVGDVPVEVANIYEPKRDAATQAIKSNAGKGRKEKDAGRREVAAQKKEDLHMQIQELVNNGSSKRNAIATINKKNPGANVSERTFDYWAVKKGFTN